MKILLFSDTHLRLPFNEKKYNFLEGIIRPVDQVIINGDFWDSSHLEFKQFIESPWKHLFPLLKMKNTIYIYGNHDRKVVMDKYVHLFSDVQASRYTMKLHDKELVIEHGNRLYPYLDDRLNMKRVNGNIVKPYQNFEKMMVRKLGNKYLKLSSSKKNKKIKEKLKNELNDSQIYICGHTHYAEIDQSNQFVNSGIVRHGLGQYLVIENNRIAAKEEWYD